MQIPIPIPILMLMLILIIILILFLFLFRLLLIPHLPSLVRLNCVCWLLGWVGLVWGWIGLVWFGSGCGLGMWVRTLGQVGCIS